MTLEGQRLGEITTSALIQKREDPSRDMHPFPSVKFPAHAQTFAFLHPQAIIFMIANLSSRRYLYIERGGSFRGFC